MIAIKHILIAFSMSADAFAASISKGMAMPKTRQRDAMRIGALFGTVEGSAPLIGWMLGNLASGFIEAVDHWVAFAILAIIGGKMIYEAFQPEDDDSAGTTHSLRRLFMTACGTSVDSMAVGASLALLEVNIVLMAMLIALATFTMSTLGIMLGHVIGSRAGRLAEFLSGLCLIAIGSSILIDHLGLI